MSKHIREAVHRREKKLRRIGDRVHDRKFLSPRDGDFLLDEIERLEAVIARQHKKKRPSKREHAEDCSMRYLYGSCTCAYSKEADHAR